MRENKTKDKSMFIELYKNPINKSKQINYKYFRSFSMK